MQTPATNARLRVRRMARRDWLTPDLHFQLPPNRLEHTLWWNAFHASVVDWTLPEKAGPAEHRMRDRRYQIARPVRRTQRIAVTFVRGPIDARDANANRSGRVKRSGI